MNEVYISSYDTTVQVGDWFYRGDEPVYKIVGIDQVCNSEGEVERTEFIVRSLDGTSALMIAESILYSALIRDDSSLELRQEGPDGNISKLDLCEIEDKGKQAAERNYRERLKRIREGVDNTENK